METKVSKLEKSKIKLKTTVTPAELADHFQHAYDDLAAGVKVAGFRPGKAPRKMVEEALGTSRLLSHAIDHSIQHFYVEALQKENISPIAHPNIAISKYPKFGLTPEEIEEALEFEAEVETFPAMELGDYKKIKVDAGKPEVAKDEDVDKVIEHFRKQRAKFSDLDRAAEMGDFTEIDFEGSHKGVKLDKLASKHFPMVLGEGNMIPGFEGEIVGLKKGDEKTFKIKFPKDYHAKEFAGEEVEFNVKLNELKKVEMPEVDTEFAKAFGHDKVEDLKKAIKESLQQEMDHKHEHGVEEKVIEKVLPLLKVDLPDALVDQELARMLKNFEAELSKQGLNFESYLKSVKKDVAEFEKELRPQAEKSVKVGLLLGQIIKDEGIDDNDSESGKKALTLLVKNLTEEPKN
ncbi:MAG: trigger factor [Patescibacteria group bacterium]|jgi:trigger factor